MNFKPYVEISQVISPDGRRRARFVLHEIYPDETQCNLNGITYLEEFTRLNANSVIGMPICATFLDEDKEIPYDHGLTGHDEFMPLFEDSVQVGSADGWSIEDIVIEGETKKVLICDCYINQQRYPKLIEWLENQRNNGITVYGSVEFVGTKENKTIIYKDGKTMEDKFRVPTEYVYSTFCIISVKASDSSAIMVELNQLNIDEKTKNDEKEKTQMEEIKKLIEDFMGKFEEANACKGNLEANAVEINELTGSVEQLKAALASVEQERDDWYKKHEELWAQTEILRESLAQAQAQQRVGEMNSALANFTDEQKAYAKEDIEAFTADPMSCEINSIITKIHSEIGKKAIEDAKTAEINSKNDNPKFDDIFAEVNSANNVDSELDLDGIFA